MRLIDAYAKIKELRSPVFRTHDVMAHLDVSRANASTILARLESAGQLLCLKRGAWALPEKADPIALVEYLTSPFPCYVSLQSALYFHGMISQLPEVVYAVSPARTRLYRTPIGSFSIHHVDPSFFFGFDAKPPSGLKMARPEKALLDFFYLSPAKSNLFQSLPEITLPDAFSIRTAKRMINQAGRSRRITLVKKKLADFLAVHFPSK